MTKLVKFDWAIKYLLRNKANFDILEGFLSELLKTDIKIETILESESNKNSGIDKYNRVDLLVQTGSNERIIIEVQCTREADYLSRMLYGSSKIIMEYLKAGDPYKNIGKVISVNIVFFDLGKGKDYLYKGTTEFRGLHYQDILELGESEEKIYGSGQTPSNIFPEYYLIKVNQFHERIKDKFDEWIYFLKNEQIKASFNAKGIQSAAKKLDILRLNEEQRRAYEQYQEYLHYEASMVDSSYGLGMKIGQEEGEKMGLEKGERIGLEKGERIGLEKGERIGQHKEKLAIAKKLYVTGMSLETIAATIELTEEEIRGYLVE